MKSIPFTGGLHVGTPSLQVATEQLKRALPDYIGLLEYGGRTQGIAGPTSDIDLIAVVQFSRIPFRFHGPRVDLNIIPLKSLAALRSRLLVNEERPWDGLFASVRIVETSNVELRRLIEDIRSAFSAPRSITEAELAGLKLAIARSIDDLVGIDDLAKLRLVVGQAVHVTLFAWTMLTQTRWAGLGDAWRRFETSEPSRHQTVAAILACTQWQETVHKLQLLETWLLERHGGSWRAGIITLNGGFSSESTDDPTPFSVTELKAIEAVCSHLDKSLRD